MRVIHGVNPFLPVNILERGYPQKYALECRQRKRLARLVRLEGTETHTDEFKGWQCSASISRT